MVDRFLKNGFAVLLLACMASTCAAQYTIEDAQLEFDEHATNVSYEITETDNILDDIAETEDWIATAMHEALLVGTDPQDDHIGDLEDDIAAAKTSVATRKSDYETAKYAALDAQDAAEMLVCTAELTEEQNDIDAAFEYCEDEFDAAADTLVFRAFLYREQLTQTAPSPPGVQALVNELKAYMEMILEIE